MKQFFTVLFALTISFTLFAQQDPNAKNSFHLGFGAGLPYGGLGVNALFNANKNIGIFGGGGYNFLRFGWNAGLKYSFAGKDSVKKSVPFVTAMYGYNAVLNVNYAGTGFYLRQTGVYLGPSFGGGIDIKAKRFDNFLSLAVLVPVRSRAFTDQYNALKNSGVNFTFPSFPVLLSVGYHVGL